MSVLEIRDLRASVEDKEILKGVNLTLRSGERTSAPRRAFSWPSSIRWQCRA